MKNPCTPDCPDRRPGDRTRPGCHADCPRYAAFRAALDEAAATREKARISDAYDLRKKSQRVCLLLQAAKRRRERARR